VLVPSIENGRCKWGEDDGRVEESVASIDERVAYLEGRVEEQGHMTNGIREALRSVEVGVAGLETKLEHRLQAFEDRVDNRFAAVDQRFATIDQRLAGIDQRFVVIDGKLDGMDGKMTRFFTWIIGLYVTGLVAVVGALIAR
jgi:hypothetical protein